MADDKEELRDSLNELQSQLDEVRVKDPALAAQLDKTISEAKAMLAGQTVRPEVHRSIVNRLSDAVEKYEASHPELAANLGSIIDALAQIGI